MGQKIDSANQQIQALEEETKTLREKNRTVLEYAGQRLREAMGDKLVELNLKAYKEVKGFLDERERHLTGRVLFVGSRW